MNTPSSILTANERKKLEIRHFYARIARNDLTIHDKMTKNAHAVRKAAALKTVTIRVLFICILNKKLNFTQIYLVICIAVYYNIKIGENALRKCSPEGAIEHESFTERSISYG